jgi:transposase
VIKFEGFSKIYLYKGFIDMRKQINGLAGFVQQELQLNPFEKYLFVFCGKRKDSVKILYWRRTGFCMWQQKLEKDKFIWPKLRDQSCIELSAEKLEWLLDGYDVWRMKNHETLNYKYVS